MFGCQDDSKHAVEVVMRKAGDVKQWHFILYYLQHPNPRKQLAADKVYNFTLAH